MSGHHGATAGWLQRAEGTAGPRAREAAGPDAPPGLAAPSAVAGARARLAGAQALGALIGPPPGLELARSPPVALAAAPRAPGPPGMPAPAAPRAPPRGGPRLRRCPKAHRATLVLAYFPRAASDEEICTALDSATGRANSVRRCHVVRDGGLYGIFEFVDQELAELALDACERGKVVLRDHLRKKWFLHGSRSRHVMVDHGGSAGGTAKPAAGHARAGLHDHGGDSDVSTAPSGEPC